MDFQLPPASERTLQAADLPPRIARKTQSNTTAPIKAQTMLGRLSPLMPVWPNNPSIPPPIRAPSTPTIMSAMTPPGASPGTIQRATKPTMSPRTIQAKIPIAIASYPNGRIGTQPARGAAYRIMKRTFLCLLLALAVTAAGAAAAETTATEITASGTGSVALPPDMATVDAAVETNAENANEAISRNNTIYNRIVDALVRAGVARGDITLAYYNVNYNPRPNGAAQSPSDERYGYTVSRNFTVKVREIGKAGAVSDASMANGATRINGVSFGLSNPSAAQAEATARAVAQARTNATALAQAAGLRIVSIKSMELGGGGGPVPLMRAAVAVNAPTQFDQSNVNVSVSVSVVFLAEP
jgi:uncharacterized protein